MSTVYPHRNKVFLPKEFFFPVVNKEWLYELWGRIEGNPWIFTFEGGEKCFMAHFLTEAELTLQGPGIVITVNNMKKRYKADVHGFIFSKRVFGSMERLPVVALWLLKNLPVERLEIRVPEDFHGLRKLLERIGFKKEGRLRKDCFDGTIRGNTIMYSFIEEDYYAC